MRISLRENRRNRYKRGAEISPFLILNCYEKDSYLYSFVCRSRVYGVALEHGWIYLRLLIYGNTAFRIRKRGLILSFFAL